MNFMKSSLWSTHLKNPLHCSLVDMLCGKHLRRMHGDCSQEKPLDDDYVSYELNYHSIVPMPTACPWLPLPGSCSKTGFDRLAGAHAFAHAIPSPWVRFLPFFVSSNLKYPQPCPPPPPGLWCLSSGSSRDTFQGAWRPRHRRGRTP